ncbi:MAG: 4Fe-4S dicluster domain-containing protein [Desulfovibrio sp.]|nr:4Fe-4S dicluster domain-containing protein [Desulfovibrio sp.]
MNKKEKNSRRDFLRAIAPVALLGALTPANAKAADSRDINRPDIIPERRKQTVRASAITPPGSGSLEKFKNCCVGCQLCAGACPNGVLTTAGASIRPELTFEYGYCRPNCSKCGEVCPADAIDALTPAQKKTIKIGSASVDFSLCVVHTDKKQCSACQRICPNQAISLIPAGTAYEGLKRPFVDQARCSGCGACEYICAARPIAAIQVSGLPAHEKLASRDD